MSILHAGRVGGTQAVATTESPIALVFSDVYPFLIFNKNKVIKTGALTRQPVSRQPRLRPAFLTRALPAFALS